MTIPKREKKLVDRKINLMRSVVVHFVSTDTGDALSQATYSWMHRCATQPDTRARRYVSAAKSPGFRCRGTSGWKTDEPSANWRPPSLDGSPPRLRRGAQGACVTLAIIITHLSTLIEQPAPICKKSSHFQEFLKLYISGRSYTSILLFLFVFYWFRTRDHQWFIFADFVMNTSAAVLNSAK